MEDYILHGEEFLAHHGILGQKWGVRRYQNRNGSLTPAGKKRYNGKSAGDKILETLRPKQKEASDKLVESLRSVRASAEAFSEAQEKANEDSQNNRERIKDYLRRHPKKLPDYAKVLTREEADEIISNIEFDRKLNDVKRTEIRRGMQKVQDLSNDIGTVSNLMTNGKNLYNNTAEIYNAMVDTGVIKTDQKMMKIGSGRDRTVIQKQLLTMKPEDVLLNQEKFTDEELKNYKNRAGYKENIYDFTEKGKAEKAAKSKQNGGNKGPAPGSFEDLIQKQNFQKAKEEFPDDFEEYIKSINAV